MAINASNYVVKTTSPNAPKISVNLQTASLEDVNSAITIYNNAAQEYTQAFVNTVTVRDYIADRFMKDLSGEVAGMTEGGINKTTNKITLHVKADDLYAQATGTISLNTANMVSNVMNEYASLYSTYYVESGTCVLDTTASNYLAEDTYDTKAFTIGDGVTLVSEGTIFINNIPNAIGNACTYTCYDNGNPQYTIVHVNQISSDVASAGWVIQDETASGALVAYTTDEVLTDSVVWTDAE